MPSSSRTTHACSTSYIVYQLLEALAGTDAIDQAMAESLYVGIMTDTGNFSFKQPDLATCSGPSPC